jgi:hypothetical protein
MAIWIIWFLFHFSIEITGGYYYNNVKKIQPILFKKINALEKQEMPKENQKTSIQANKTQIKEPSSH